MDSSRIHPADEMYKTALISFQGDETKARDFYTKSGHAICDRVANWLREHNRDPSQLSILDFACGYGRVTRHFAKIFGEVTVSDLEPEMLGFISELCGAEGFLSNIDLARVKWPPRDFDVVFTYSLFTHLHPEIWSGWFEAVSERVRPGGFMFLTTRGVEFARRTGEAVAEGEQVRFTEKNETEGRLDTSIYGRTTLAREFVDDVLKGQHRLLPMSRVGYFKGGEFDQYQDMHVLVRATGV